jgi:hypothetical protein
MSIARLDIQEIVKSGGDVHEFGEMSALAMFHRHLFYFCLLILRTIYSGHPDWFLTHFGMDEFQK